jgi:signal transduction histidine kinase
VSPIKDESGKVLRWFGTDTDIEEQKLTEERLRTHGEQLRALLARMQEVREEERTNVARDLHDQVGQIMAAVKMDLSWILNHSQENPDAVQHRVSGTLDLINDGVKSVRKMCTELRPGILDDLGLVAAVEWQAAEFANRSGIQCNLAVPARRLDLDRDTSTAVFRIFQEALTNVARHANASEVQAKIAAGDGQLMLTVTDNGVGIEGEKTGGTFGILGMQERAAVLGGTVELTGSPGKGTTVKLLIPLKTDSSGSRR